jgi:AAA15 family ATPase/GTPase
MILEFGAKNFFSFKEGFEILFQKSKQSTSDISNIIALKGANASGKTNVIKVLSFLQSFVTDSFNNLKPDEKIGFSSYFNNNNPTEIYIVFLQNNIEYRYELVLNNKEVINEKIYRTQDRKTLLIERDNHKIKTIKEYKELEAINITRDNASIISIAKQYGIDKINIIFELFNFITNVYKLGKLDNKEIYLDYQEVSQYYYENKYFLKFVISFLKKVDTGIEDINILERKDPETNEIIYFPIFNYDINDKDKFLTYHDQSTGTQTLYIQLHLYLLVTKVGGVLALDEFDINLHPDLLPLLLDFFDDKELNKKNAQFILTTHNYDIMDKLGKYKTILVNKEDNESFLYRLDEIAGDIVRNDRKISPIYNANKIGGKPKIK